MKKGQIFDLLVLVGSIGIISASVIEKERQYQVYSEIETSSKIIENAIVAKENIVKQIRQIKSELKILQLPYAFESGNAASAQMLVEVRELLKRAGIYIEKSKIKEIKKIKLVEEIRIEIRGIADLFALREAIFLIESMDHAFSIERLTVKSNRTSANPKELQIEIEVLGFILKSPIGDQEIPGL